MKILTNNQISDLCDKLLLVAQSENSEFKVHIELMYRYGLRVSEACSSDIFQKLQNGDLMFMMVKTGYQRIIKSDEFINDLDIIRLMSFNDNKRVSELNIKRYINKISPYRRLFIGNKHISTHIFRHNFAKKNFERLQNYTQVNELLQEKNIEVCKGYIHSVIYY